jgi:beta-lactamase regulating signal transducer with metallopeptidase domain
MIDYWAEWWLRTACAGGGLLVLTALILRGIRQPSIRQCVGAWGVRGAVLAALLALGPQWLNPWSPPPPATPTKSANVIWVEVPAPFVTTPSPAETPAEPTASVPWLLIALVVYGAIVLYRLARLGLGYIGLRRLLVRARPARAAVLAVFAAVRGTWRRVRLCVCARLRSPVACGLLRPTIVLPADFDHTADESALRSVLAHELTHLRRGDAWTSLWVQVASALFWYVPSLRGLRRQLVLDQEYIADAAAVAAGSAETYAALLVAWAHHGRGTVPMGATGVQGAPSDLFRRVTMILEATTKVDVQPTRGWSLAAACGALGLAVISTGLSLRAAEPAKPTKPTNVLVPAAATPAPVVVPMADLEALLKAPNGPALARVKQLLAAEAELVADLDLATTEAVRRYLLIAAAPPASPANRMYIEVETLKQAVKDLEGKDEVARKAALDRLRQYLQQVEIDVKMPTAVVSGQIAAPGMAWSEFKPFTGRLGVQVEAPSAALVAQLELPAKRGLVVANVLPDSIAAKAGIKVNDLLLEVADQEVSTDPEALAKQIADLKADAVISVVVLRKGKKETIKDIKVPALPVVSNKVWSPKVVKPIAAAGPLGGPPQFTINITTQPRDTVASLSTQLAKDGSFSASRTQNKVAVSIEGQLKDGKASVTSINIQDDGTTVTTKHLNKVPESYRDTVNGLVKLIEATPSK